MNGLPKAPVVLTVGGLDPTGGAGILLDGAAIRAAGCHQAGVVSVLTSQDGTSFGRAKPVLPESVAAGLEAVFRAVEVRAIKTGTLGTAAIVEVVIRMAAANPGVPLVVDPVLRATSGGELLDPDGAEALRQHLLPVATFVTPNLEEAAFLVGQRIEDRETMVWAGEQLVQQGAGAVLIKGGHLGGNEVFDVLVEKDTGVRTFGHGKKVPVDVRGTGCALASLVAAWLARGYELGAAVDRAQGMVQAAIRAARQIGQGSGPPVLGPPIGPDSDPE